MAEHDELRSLAREILERGRSNDDVALQAYRRAVLRVARSVAEGDEFSGSQLRRRARELHLLTIGVAASLEAVEASLPSPDPTGLTGEFGGFIERLTCTAGCRKDWDNCIEAVRESTGSGGGPGDPLPASPEVLDAVVACDLGFALCLFKCGLVVW